MTPQFHVMQDPKALSRRPTWWSLKLTLAAATLLALVTSSQIQLSMIDHGHDWWRIFLWQFCGLAFWVLPAPWISRSGGRLLGSRPPWWLAREATKALGWTAVQLPFVTFFFVLLQPLEPMETYSVNGALRYSFLTWSHLDLLIYGIGLAIGYGVEGQDRARRSELRQSQLDTELARAQLESLRLQIQPHFLFNTLHSIAALMRGRRNDQALGMLLGLAELLRATLERSDRQRIPLREELSFLRLYVDLQSARFADRLTVTYDIQEEALEHSVPTLLLQPLVENAIRHGIAPRAAPGRVRIAAGIEGDRLRLTVSDDGVGLPEGFDVARDTGVGLGNTRSRVARLHGEDASVDLQRQPEGGTMVVVVLPAEEIPSQPRAAAA